MQGNRRCMHRVGLDVNAASDSITEGALMWNSVN